MPPANATVAMVTADAGLLRASHPHTRGARPPHTRATQKMAAASPVAAPDAKPNARPDTSASTPPITVSQPASFTASTLSFLQAASSRYRLKPLAAPKPI